MKRRQFIHAVGAAGLLASGLAGAAVPSRAFWFFG